MYGQTKSFLCFARYFYIVLHDCVYIKKRYRKSGSDFVRQHCAKEVFFYIPIHCIEYGECPKVYIFTFFTQFLLFYHILSYIFSSLIDNQELDKMFRLAASNVVSQSKLVC